MMDPSDDSIRSTTSSPRRESIDYRESDLRAVPNEEENVVLPPELAEHEIESTPIHRPWYRKSTVWGVAGLSVVIVVALIVLFSGPSPQQNNQEGSPSLNVADDAKHNDGNSANGGYVFTVGENSTVISPPTFFPTVAPTVSAPQKTTPKPTAAKPHTPSIAPARTTNGPTSIFPTSIGPASIGPTSIGATSIGPTSIGPTSIGPTSIGPTSIGPTSIGPTSIGPTSIGPTSIGPTSIGPTSVGPTSIGPTAEESSSGFFKFPTATSDTHQPTQPVHEKQGCLNIYLENENMRTNNRLYKGQFICNGDGNRYRFGVDVHGNVVWGDKEQNELKLLYKNPYRKQNQHKDSTVELKETFYLELQRNGYLVLHWVDIGEEGTDDSVVWTAHPTEEIMLTERCKPKHDCPYLHMQPGGILAVDWLSREDLDGDGKYDWEEKNVFNLYDY